MHQLSCIVALTGDVANKIFLERVTPPEIMLLRLIHGENSVTEIRVMGDVKTPKSQIQNERERLLGKYPKYHDQIIGLWRDSGGTFIESVHKLGLDAALFAFDRELPKAMSLPEDLPDDEDEGEPVEAVQPRIKKAGGSDM